MNNLCKCNLKIYGTTSALAIILSTIAKNKHDHEHAIYYFNLILLIILFLLCSPKKNNVQHFLIDNSILNFLLQYFHKLKIKCF